MQHKLPTCHTSKTNLRVERSLTLAPHEDEVQGVSSSQSQNLKKENHFYPFRIVDINTANNMQPRHTRNTGLLRSVGKLEVNYEGKVSID